MAIGSDLLRLNDAGLWRPSPRTDPAPERAVGQNEEKAALPGEDADGMAALADGNDHRFGGIDAQGADGVRDGGRPDGEQDKAGDSQAAEFGAERGRPIWTSRWPARQRGKARSWRERLQGQLAKTCPHAAPGSQKED